SDGEISAEEAVWAYHAVLQQLGVKPQRTLEEDMTLQTNVMSYGGNGKVISAPPPSPRTAVRGLPGAKRDCACGCNGACASATGEPDFKKMTNAEKIAWHKARWDRILG